MRPPAAIAAKPLKPGGGEGRFSARRRSPWIVEATDDGRSIGAVARASRKPGKRGARIIAPYHAPSNRVSGKLLVSPGRAAPMINYVREGTVIFERPAASMNNRL